MHLSTPPVLPGWTNPRGPGSSKGLAVAGVVVAIVVVVTGAAEAVGWTSVVTVKGTGVVSAMQSNAARVRQF